jgi:hypothetical protein
MLHRPAQFKTAAAIQFAADSLRDKSAAVLLPPVDVSDEFVREGDGYAFYNRHFILSV